jgi:polyisoprenoid-binding protein YceI
MTAVVHRIRPRTGKRGAGRAVFGRRLPGLLLAGGLLMATTGQDAHGAPYAVDTARSEIAVVVFKGGAASMLAHDHVVRAARWQATLDVSVDPVALAADVRVDATGLEIDEPEARTRHGLDGTLSDGDRATVRATMLGAGQLDVARYPEIRFSAAEIDRAADPGGAGTAAAGGAFRLAGELHLHGRTKRVSLPLAIARDGDAFTARGRVRVKQSDFGITPYSAFLGAVRTQDEVEIVFILVAVPAAAR